MNRFVFLFLTIIVCFVCTGSASATAGKSVVMVEEVCVSVRSCEAKRPSLVQILKAQETVFGVSWHTRGGDDG